MSRKEHKACLVYYFSDRDAQYSYSPFIEEEVKIIEHIKTNHLQQVVSLLSDTSEVGPK